MDVRDCIVWRGILELGEELGAFDGAAVGDPIVEFDPALVVILMVPLVIASSPLMMRRVMGSFSP
jgi:hypothetical protein